VVRRVVLDRVKHRCELVFPFIQPHRNEPFVVGSSLEVSHPRQLGGDHIVLHFVPVDIFGFCVQERNDGFNWLNPFAQLLHHLSRWEVIDHRDECCTLEVAELRSPALGIDSVLIFISVVFRWHLVHAEDPRSGGDCAKMLKLCQLLLLCLLELELR
jgi:hypothetical protein